ncbi:MAG: cytochrome ubiquinol oxidase subunit I [Rhizobacter sp.]
MDLSNLDASRLLFGFTAAYHFLFVPVTIGLMALIAVFEGWSLLTGRPALRIAARFLTLPFLLHFACGILTGYPLRHQIELHWSGYAAVVQQVVGTVFAFEGLVAPWLFALVAMFALGWHLKPVWHWLISTALAVVLVVQSGAILMINAWMQLPVGATFDGHRARVDHLLDLAGNPLLVPKVLHTVGGAWVLGGFLGVSISACFLLRQRHADIAGPSLRAAAVFTLVALLLTGAAGHWSGERLAKHQPVKFAAIEALWDSDPGGNALLLFALPDPAGQRNRFEIGLPGALDWIAHAAPGELRGLRALAEDTGHDLQDALDDIPPSRLGPTTLFGASCCATRPTDAEIDRVARQALPPVATVFWSFRVMLLAWGVMLCLVIAVLCRPADRRLLSACVWAVPLPWVAIEAGWLVCEAGRQPWTITGVLATRASLGHVSAAEVGSHLLVALVLGALLLGLHVALNLAHLRGGLRPAPARSCGKRQNAPRPSLHHLSRSP